MLTPRNHIEVLHLDAHEMANVDTLFEICDAEFNSRNDVHNSFERTDTYFLYDEVQKIAVRDELYCTRYMAQIVANEISCVWFSKKETV